MKKPENKFKKIILCFRKSATNGLRFFVRYDNMYCSDAQMSLLGKQGAVLMAQ